MIEVQILGWPPEARECAEIQAPAHWAQGHKQAGRVPYTGKGEKGKMTRICCECDEVATHRYEDMLVCRWCAPPEAEAIVNKAQGAFERLMADIEETVASAEGDWWMDEGTLVVHTTVSRDPSRNRNGGEYDFYRDFCSHGIGGVHAQGSWSADFDYEKWCSDDTEEYDCIVTTDGLERMARMADLTIAARAWLAHP